MKNLIAIILAGSSLLSGIAHAEVWQGKGHARFSVKATGHTVHGEVPLRPFAVTASKADGDMLLSWKNDVEILKMGTKKKKRDEEMYHVLHSDKHPFIHGEVNGLSVAALEHAGDESVTFPIQFHLAGIPTEKEVKVLQYDKGKEGVSLQVAFEVSQLEHGLSPIRKMGFLKVKDTVHVEVFFTLVP